MNLPVSREAKETGCSTPIRTPIEPTILEQPAVEISPDPELPVLEQPTAEVPPDPASMTPGQLDTEIPLASDSHDPVENAPPNSLFQNGALGKEEEALVICDVNPLAASGSRPRPESMLRPLALIAHLPIIESVTYRRATKAKDGRSCGPYDQCRCGRREGQIRDTSPRTEDKAINALRRLSALLDKFDSQKRYTQQPRMISNQTSWLKHWIN